MGLCLIPIPPSCLIPPFKALCDADDKCLSFAMSATATDELKDHRVPAGSATAKFYPFGTQFYEDTSSKYPHKSDANAATATPTAVWLGGKPDGVSLWVFRATVPHPVLTVHALHAVPFDFKFVTGGAFAGHPTCT